MRRLFAVAVLLVALFSGAAWADTLTFELNTPFPGDPAPAGSAPWLTAEFLDSAAGEVTLTLTGNLGSQFVSGFFFNILEPFPAALVINQSSGITAGITKGEDCCKADGDGYYDFLLSFPDRGSDPRFTGTEVAVFTLSLAGIAASDFNAVSTHSGGAGEFTAAAHVQSLPGGASTWIYDGGGTPPEELTPEPATFVLFGSALLLGGGIYRRRCAR